MKQLSEEEVRLMLQKLEDFFKAEGMGPSDAISIVSTFLIYAMDASTLKLSTKCELVYKIMRAIEEERDDN